MALGIDHVMEEIQLIKSLAALVKASKSSKLVFFKSLLPVSMAAREALGDLSKAKDELKDLDPQEMMEVMTALMDAVGALMDAIAPAAA